MAVKPHRLTDAQLLHRYADASIKGKAVPENVVLPDGKRLPMLIWLKRFEFDQSVFESTDLANHLGLMASPALACEAAFAIRERIQAAR